LGQVRKDILNGWKEIGAYVSRDSRTVERWEKMRGLPVRRMPGAGRATVYALTSELDEWLENGGPEDPQLSGIAAEPQSIVAINAGAEGFTNKEQRANTVEARFPTLSLAGGRLNRLFNPIAARHRMLTSAALLAVVASVVTAFAWPELHGRTTDVVSDDRTLDHSDTKSAGTYRSRVPGVDELYLRGVYAYEQRTPESLQQSLEEFSEAVAKDPQDAPAYAGMANTYSLLREYSMMPDADAYPRAKQAAERAIALDPDLAEAHASLGFIDFFWSWDAVSAEREFQTAISLDPNSVVAHHWYGSMLMHEDRLAEANEQLDIAQRLAPSSAAILSTRALAEGLDGHRNEAIEMLQDAIHVTPGSSSPHAFIATLSNVEPRDPGRFLAEMKWSAALRNDPEMLKVADAAADAYQSGDEMRMWAAILATEEKLHPEANQRTYLMAEAEAALGRREDAVSDLQRLADRHDPSVIGVMIDPVLLPLHSDRQFAQLVATVGLPPSRK
jgi:tetratricopeptide (TPR) repeat protein